MIKAIYLDGGCTFVKSFKNKENELNGILEPFGWDWQRFYIHWRRFYLLRSWGKIATDEELEILIKKITGADMPVQKIIDVIIESHDIPKEYIDVVRNLKKEYKVGILSNNVAEWFYRVLDNYNIRDLFEIVVISSEVGARKPDAMIYYEALKRSSVEPEESVLIADEVAEDLVAASGLGMRTIWFKNRDKECQNTVDEKILKIYSPDATAESFEEIPLVLRKMDS